MAAGRQASLKFIDVREFRDSDLSGIAALQEHVDPELRLTSEAFAALWDWLYRRNVMGPLVVVVAETSDGTIVGHEGLMPFALSCREERLLGGISCNLIVATEQRQTLLFPRIVRALIKRHRPAGFDVIYGPARPKIAEALQVLGYRNVGALPVYVRPFIFGPFIAHAVGNPALRRALMPLGRMAAAAVNSFRPRRLKTIEVRQVESISEALGAFAKTATAQFPIHAVRSRDIMAWRFFGLPDRSYTIVEALKGGDIVGYAALRRMNMLGFDTLAIVDILFSLEQPEVGRALMRAVHDEAVRLNVAAAACMVGDGSPLIPMLRRAGYLRAPEGFSMVVHETATESPRFSVDALRSWYVTWYDHDYV
jgi:predicted N-acetyltransferase YhbS